VQLQVSLDPKSPAARDLAKFKGLHIVTEDAAAFQTRLSTFLPYNVITLEGQKQLEPLLAMHWVSRVFPMGHIKSVRKADEAFAQKFSNSRKWLAVEVSQSRL